MARHKRRSRSVKARKVHRRRSKHSKCKKSEVKRKSDGKCLKRKSYKGKMVLRARKSASARRRKSRRSRRH